MIFKNAAAEHQQGGMGALSQLIGGAENLPQATDEDCSSQGAPTRFSDDNTVQTLFDYSCTSNTAQQSITIPATGNNNDSSLKEKTLKITLNLSNGTQQINLAATCPIFGGSKQNCRRSHSRAEPWQPTGQAISQQNPWLHRCDIAERMVKT